MPYTVRYGDSLSRIAQKTLGNANRWPELARLNRLHRPDHILAGQTLLLPDGAKHVGTPPPWAEHLRHPGPQPDRPPQDRPATGLSARGLFYVVADEVNPLSQKLVRKVIKPAGLESNPKLLEQILNPEKHGFQPRQPGSNVTPGRHLQGMTNSEFISASERPLGSPRFQGKRYWIDVDKLKQSGASIVDAAELSRDVDRILAKTKDPNLIARLKALRELSQTVDHEVLIRGPVPAGAVKGAGAMAATRGLQVLGGVGIVLTAYDLGKAGVQSYEQKSVKPIAAETIRQAGGWGMAWAGAEGGAALGAALGIETGPGAVITGAVGGLIGGVAGYFGFDLLADQIHAN